MRLNLILFWRCSHLLSFDSRLSKGASNDNTEKGRRDKAWKRKCNVIWFVASFFCCLYFVAGSSAQLWQTSVKGGNNIGSRTVVNWAIKIKLQLFMNHLKAFLRCRYAFINIMLIPCICDLSKLLLLHFYFCLFFRMKSSLFITLAEFVDILFVCNDKKSDGRSNVR
jgi:hypothetical protein